MNVILTCGLSDGKLQSKLEGLIAIPRVERIFIVRRRPLSAAKVVNCCPPGWIAKSVVIFEFWRLLILFFLSIKCKPKLIIGIQAQMHGCVAVFVGRVLRIQSALWLIGSDVFIYSKHSIFAPLIKSAIRNAGTVYVMGESSKNQIRSLVGRKDRVYIQQVDFSPLVKNGLNLERTEWDLVFVGNLVDVKNPLLLISIFSSLQKLDPNVRLCIVGDGVLKSKMASKVDEMGLSGVVDFKGCVPDPLKYIKKSKVLVIPSKSEGLPSVLIEAAQAGVPVVASAVGEIPGISKGCDGIFCIEPGDLNSFVSVCSEIINDDEKRAIASKAISEFGQDYCSYWNADTQRLIWEKAFDS